MEPTIRIEPPHTLWVGDTPYRWAAIRSEDYDVETVEPLHVRQALFKFESGWVVSVVWGDFTYSSYDASAEAFTEEPTRVDVAILFDGDFVGDEVFARVGADWLNRLIPMVASWSTTLGVYRAGFMVERLGR